MADSNFVTLTLGFKDTDFTRNLKIDNVEADALSSVKQNVLDVNASLSADTAGGLSSFFVSDDFDADAGKGYFTGITAAQYTTQTVTEIDLDD